MSAPRPAGKLGTYIRRGGKAWDPDPGENVLYLGAAQGVTAAYVASTVPDGTVLAVEKSAVAGLGLLDAAERASNLLAFIGDARLPDSYAPIVPELGLLYQDLAQRDQVEILVRNARTFGARRAFLALKARSVAVQRPPTEVFEQAAAELQQAGADVVDVMRLDPVHRDHAMIVVDLPTDRSA